VDAGDRPGRSGGAVAAPVAAAVGIVAVAVMASVPASPFHPLLPDGAGSGPLAPIARLFGLDQLRRDPLAGVGIAAMVLATAAFLWALWEAWRGRISLRLALVVGVAFHVLVVVLPLMFSRDVYSYGIYGRIASVHGGNPYVVVPADVPGDPLYPLVGEQWIDTPAVYGPLFTLLSSLITRFVEDPVALIWVFKVIAGAGSVAAMFLAAWLCRRLRPSRAAFAVLLIGWNPVVLFHTLGGGHNDTLVGLAVVGAAALVMAGRDLWATAVLTLGALVKAPAVVAVALLVVVVVAKTPAGQRFREGAKHIGVAVGLALVAALPFLQMSDPTLGQLELATHEGWLAPSNLFGRVFGKLGELIGGDTGRSVGESVLRVVFPLVFLVAFVAIARHVAARARGLKPEGQVAAWAWALLVFMLCAPVLLPWYVAWVLPVVWLLPRVPRLAAVVVSTALSVSEVMAEPLRGREIFEGMVLGLHYVITPVVFLVLVWLLVDLRRRLREGVPLEAEREDVPARAR
jgi:hypothetical protein